MNKKFLCLVCLALILTSVNKVFAHHPDNSLMYLRIYENANIEGTIHVNINELNDVLGLHLNKKTSVEAVEPYADKIRKYLIKNTIFSAGNAVYKMVFTNEIRILSVGYGDFVIFHFYLENSDVLPDEIDVVFKVFIEEEPQHQNLLGQEYNWKAGLINNEKMIDLYFSHNDWKKTLSLKDRSIMKGFMAMIRQGIWHIWIGIDHILFIVALILPAVVRRKKASIWGWEPVERFKPAFIYIIKIITFFTIAHTITLSLASLNIISLPSRVVESIIALSIGLAAYHNIKPIFKGKDWLIAFVFGLFHGFGFASVLGELGFNGENLALTLLGFNIGVEIGQLAIITAIFPILYFIRNFKLYPKFLVYLSALLIIISLYWVLERALDIDLPIDNYIRRYGYQFAVWLGLR